MFHVLLIVYGAPVPEFRVNLILSVFNQVSEQTLNLSVQGLKVFVCCAIIANVCLQFSSL